MSIHRAHPDYSEGFFAALEGRAPADDATAAFRAGWDAATEARKIMLDAGFVQNGPCDFGKTMIVPNPSAGPGEGG